MPVPEPAWLIRARAKPVKTKAGRDRIRYYSKVCLATPVWLSPLDKNRIRRLYKKARKQGLSVDHIVPLSSPLVCGLHVPWNLQLMPRKANMAKSNTHWPGCPFEQMELRL